MAMLSGKRGRTPLCKLFQAGRASGTRLTRLTEDDVRNGRNRAKTWKKRVP